MNLLIVDDDYNLCRAIERNLLWTRSDMFTSIITANSVGEAQERLASGAKVDAVLSDVMMGNETGADLHRWLEMHHPDLARGMVFMTGGISSGAVADYLQSLQNVCLAKPMSADAIVEALRA